MAQSGGKMCAPDEAVLRSVERGIFAVLFTLIAVLVIFVTMKVKRHYAGYGMR